MSRRTAILLIGAVGSCALPAEALPSQGLYVTQFSQASTPAIDMVIGQGVFQFGYLPEPNPRDRLWYGSLRMPIQLLGEGRWWPQARILLGYHRQQTPIGKAFQAFEAGGMVTKELPFNFSAYTLGTAAQSLNGSDTLLPLVRFEVGLGWQATPGSRIFAGYQSWQSPVGLGTEAPTFSNSREFSGFLVGIDMQLAQLAGFPGDNE